MLFPFKEFILRPNISGASAGRAEHDADAGGGDRRVPLHGDPSHGHHRPPHPLQQVRPMVFLLILIGSS